MPGRVISKWYSVIRTTHPVIQFTNHCILCTDYLEPGGRESRLTSEVGMRSFVLLLATLLLATVPGFAQFASPGGPIPVVANLPGLNQTFWRSDVYVLNMNSSDSSFVMVLYPEIVNNEPTFDTAVTDTIQISAGEQLTFTNIVQSVFGFDDAKGGLHLISLDGLPLVFSSRTYTVPDGGGSFGQNVHGTYVTNTAWITGVRHDSLYRTNVGIFVPVDPVSGLNH